MLLQVGALAEILEADVALERFLAIVLPKVIIKVCALVYDFSAAIKHAVELPVVLVGLAVQHLGDRKPFLRHVLKDFGYKYRFVVHHLWFSL